MRDPREEIRRRLEPLHLSPIREAEIVEELAQHCEDRYRELRAAGMSGADAAAGALQEIADEEALRREVARLERPAPLALPPLGAPSRARWFSSLWHDTRVAARTLLRSRGFSATVLLAVAFAIGPTTAVFSIGNWLLWRPQPGVAQPDRVAVVWFGEWRTATSWSPSWVTEENLASLRARSRTLGAIAGIQEGRASLSMPGVLPREKSTAHADWNFLDLLGVRMRAGRGFLPDDGRSGGPAVVISEPLARTLFADPESALGRSISLNSRPFQVVGVAAGDFRGLSPTDAIDIWIPGAAYGYLNHSPSAGAARFYAFVVRLAPDADFSTLQSELDALVPALADDADEDNDKFSTVRARVYPGLGVAPLAREQTERKVDTMVMIALVLMLLGCANVANLLILRAARRGPEIGIRKAIGATSGRLVQLQLLESCLLAIAGAALGLALAVVLKQLIQDLLFPRAPGVPLNVPLDLRVLGMTMAAAMVTGVAAAAVPAWIVMRARATATIARSGSRTGTRAPRLRSALGGLQLALSLALLVGALLLVTTLHNLRAVDIGLDPDDVTAFGVNLMSHGYTSERHARYYREALAGLEQRGEFEAVALAEGAPFGPGEGIRIRPPRAPDEPPVRALSNTVTHDYFRLLRIPIVRGRGFAREETLNGPAKPIAIVNETVARAFYGTLDVVGETIRLVHLKQPLTIVGVARDSYWRNITREAGLFVYLPLDGLEMPYTQVLVRSRLPPASVAETATAVVARIDPGVPLSSVRPLTTGIDRELSDHRLFAWVLSLLAGVGFVLASLGLFALVAQSVTERTREFGIRLALGAKRRDIVRLVARYALTVTLGGLAAGLALAWFGTRAVDHLLFGVTPLDPGVYLAAVLTLVGVVALACVAPIRRATHVQPVDVLRAE